MSADPEVKLFYGSVDAIDEDACEEEEETVLKNHTVKPTEK